MLKDWTPIERAGDGGRPYNRAQRESIIRQLQDGILRARARRCVIIERPQVYADIAHIEDPIAAAMASSHFQWGEPTTVHEINFELPPELWLASKLGNPDLALWSNGEERMTDPYSAAPGYEGDRATFYGLELCVAECSIGSENKSRRGRTMGSGSYATADAPLVEKMRELIRDGKARSPDEAAKRFARDAAGGGTEASKATRLAKRYRDSESK